MLNSVIIFNSKKPHSGVSEAKYVSKVISQLCDVTLVDMASSKPLHEYFFELQNYHADLYITIELAGFELKTEADKSSFNIIHGRFFHIIKNEEAQYPELLEVKNNLAHFICQTDEDKISFSNAINHLMKEAELI